nr:unnamed protein product [Digitaria exilis]
MERKFYDKYNAFKKRKLLDEGLERKQEEERKELYDAMKDWISGLEKDKEELNQKLSDKEDELDKARHDLLADIRARDSEILRLKQLLDEKTKTGNCTAIRSVEQTPEVIWENPTRISPRRKTKQSNIKEKRVHLNENTAISHSSHEEESQEQECSRRHTFITGYSFTLTWLEKPGEWSYKLSSLGTLERLAVNWMKEDIRFSMNMCCVFFERISNVIMRG